MKIIIHRKEKHIVESIIKHADTVSETVKEFLKALESYLEGDTEKTAMHTKNTHKKEHEADNLRREVGKDMYEGAFMPSIREVLFIALDFIDKVANAAETSGDFLTLVQPTIPDEIKENLRKMSELTAACAEKLVEGVHNLFENATVVFKDTREIERLEGEVDKYVWNSIEAIFKKLNISKFSEKLMLRDLILHVNSITNKMEDASDKLDIIALRLKI
jgi:predicted phosphate transport protein (TIGR00153 family)